LLSGVFFLLYNILNISYNMSHTIYHTIFQSIISYIRLSRTVLHHSMASFHRFRTCCAKITYNFFDCYCIHTWSFQISIALRFLNKTKKYLRMADGSNNSRDYHLIDLSSSIYFNSYLLLCYQNKFPPTYDTEC